MFRFIAIFLILFLSGCSHDPQGVRIYHYGLSDGGSNNGIHTVHAGDTLWSISQRYNVPLRDLMDINEVRPPYELNTGERLMLPAPNTYEVRKGDSLSSIARMFKISVRDLSRLNEVPSPYIIHPGQTLRVPSSVARVQYAELNDNNNNKGQSYVPDQRQASVNSEKAKPQTKPVYKQSKALKKSKLETPAPRSSGRFMSPVNGKTLSSFGPKEDSLHNDGINIKAPRGASVRAAENGIIVYADDELEGFGNLILIKHADQYITAYAHMDKMVGKKGGKVKRGEIIGTVGSTGHVKEPQLHFEVRRGTKALDPAKYIE